MPMSHGECEVVAGFDVSFDKLHRPFVFRLHQMQTIVTNDHGVCQPVCHMAQLAFTLCCSFGATFAKSFWCLVTICGMCSESSCLHRVSLFDFCAGHCAVFSTFATN